MCVCAYVCLSVQLTFTECNVSYLPSGGLVSPQWINSWFQYLPPAGTSVVLSVAAAAIPVCKCVCMCVDVHLLHFAHWSLRP